MKLKTKLHTAFSSRINTIGLPILALCWISFFWGTTWIASKEGVKHMPALQLAAIRQFLAGLLYLAFFIYKKAPWPNKNQWRTIVILSFLNFICSNGLSTWGVKYISSGLGAIIGSIFPLWIVIISLFKGEKIASLAIKGMCVCFIGICIVFYDYLGDFLRPDFQFGIFLSVVATLTWAFATLYTKEKAADFNPYFSLGLQMMLSSITLFIGMRATGTDVSVVDIPMVSWLAIGYLVIFGSVLTFIAFIYSLQHLPTEVNSLYAYINPIVALIIGALLFDEPFTFLIVIGGCITLIGLYVVNISIRRTKQDQIVIKKAAD